MEEAPFLVTVQRAIDGIQIQEDLDGCLLVRPDEAIDEQRFKCTRYMRDLVIAAAASGRGVLEPFNVDLPGSGSQRRRRAPSLPAKLASTGSRRN